MKKGGRRRLHGEDAGQVPRVHVDRGGHRRGAGRLLLLPHPLVHQLLHADAPHLHPLLRHRHGRHRAPPHPRLHRRQGNSHHRTNIQKMFELVPLRRNT